MTGISNTGGNNEDQTKRFTGNDVTQPIPQANSQANSHLEDTHAMPSQIDPNLKLESTEPLENPERRAIHADLEAADTPTGVMPLNNDDDFQVSLVSETNEAQGDEPITQDLHKADPRLEQTLAYQGPKDDPAYMQTAIYTQQVKEEKLANSAKTSQGPNPGIMVTQAFQNPAANLEATLIVPLTKIREQLARMDELFTQEESNFFTEDDSLLAGQRSFKDLTMDSDLGEVNPHFPDETGYYGSRLNKYSTKMLEKTLDGAEINGDPAFLFMQLSSKALTGKPDSTLLTIYNAMFQKKAGVSRAQEKQEAITQAQAAIEKLTNSSDDKKSSNARTKLDELLAFASRDGIDLKANDTWRTLQSKAKEVEQDPAKTLDPSLKSLFDSVSQIVEINQVHAKERQEAYDISEKLISRKLKARIAIIARDFAQELSLEEKTAFLLHSLSPNPSPILRTQYSSILERLGEKIAPDQKYLNEDFFNSTYQSSLIKAVEIEIGAHKSKLREITSEFENNSNTTGTKAILAAKLLKEMQIGPELVKLVSPKQLEKLESKHEALVENLADTLKRAVPGLSNYRPKTISDLTRVFIDNLQNLSQAKSEAVYEASKDAILADTSFFIAAKRGKTQEALSILAKHIGNENIANPLRRLMIISRMYDDHDFQMAIKKAPTKFQAFKDTMAYKVGAPIALLGLAVSGAGLGASGLQESRDVYGKDLGAQIDTVDLDLLPKLEAMKDQLEDLNKWDNKKVFTAGQIAEAGEQDLVDVRKNPVGYFASKIIPTLEDFKDIKDTPIVSINVNQSDAKEQLINLIQSQTDLFEGLNQEQKEEIAENYFTARTRMEKQFSGFSDDAPINFMPIQFKNAQGQEKELIVLESNSIERALKPFNDDNPKNIQMLRVYELTASFTSLKANRSLFDHVLSKDNEELLFSSHQNFMKAGGARGFRKIVNTVTFELDNTRQKLNLKGLRD